MNEWDYWELNSLIKDTVSKHKEKDERRIFYQIFLNSHFNCFEAIQSDLYLYLEKDYKLLVDKRAARAVTPFPTRAGLTLSGNGSCVDGIL